jgi:hypothetical protein
MSESGNNNGNLARRNGGTKENVDGEISGEDQCRPRIQARQQGQYLRIEAGRIMQRDAEEQATVLSEAWRR